MNAPSKIQWKKKSGLLVLTFGEKTYELTSEFLRVHSPSAEVKGHGPNQAVLQFGKKEVKLEGLERAGNYALKLVFDDGHNSGIYTWDYLYELATKQAQYWDEYLIKLQQQGKSREADTSVIRLLI